jgi:hypothetical protein
VTHEWDSESEKIIPPRPPLDREVAARILKDKGQEWAESPACDKLKTILSSSARDHEINKIVGFSLGSVAKQWISDDGSEAYVENRWRAASQHALLHTLLEWLQGRDHKENHKENVLCYSQDPAYTEVDKQILDEAGVEVIDDPRGWLETDEHSVVLSVASNVPVKEIITDIARPAVVIWCRVGLDDGLDEGR